MELEENKKCSSKDHLNVEAISYCPKCQIYMCNKCNNIHTNLCPKHNQYKLDQDINDIFTGFCKNDKHPMKLEYFCKSHNELCCAACLYKIVKIGDGKHKDCDVCIINEIKNIKKNSLGNNIKNWRIYLPRLKIQLKKLKIYLKR